MKRIIILLALITISMPTKFVWATTLVTYHNSTVGYSFKYPSNLTTQEFNSTPVNGPANNTVDIGQVQ
ncbi:MAG TPA: hypothetical protein VHQ20_00970, partial [Patescibacteria group bacterium]|nr:hypothetical protein [Patescibacteria group bacterium]